MRPPEAPGPRSPPKQPDPATRAEILADCVRTGRAHTPSDLRQRADLHVEAELDDVPIRHHVVLALHTYLARRLRGGHRPSGDEVVERHDLGLDEALVEVRVDHAGRLGGGGALPDGPGAGLLWAGGQ